MDEDKAAFAVLRAKMAYLRVFQCLTHKDVAERMGVAPKTVRALEDGRPALLHI